MSDLPNKSVETMMLNLNGDDPQAIRNMQHFLSQGSWQDSAILQRHWQEVRQDLDDENAVFIVDSSGFPKQGNESVGVKRGDTTLNRGCTLKTAKFAKRGSSDILESLQQQNQ